MCVRARVSECRRKLKETKVRGSSLLSSKKTGKHDNSVIPKHQEKVVCVCFLALPQEKLFGGLEKIRRL